MGVLVPEREQNLVKVVLRLVDAPVDDGFRIRVRDGVHPPAAERVGSLQHVIFAVSRVMVLSEHVELAAVAESRAAQVATIGHVPVA